MKITDIVKVTISSEVPISTRGFLNREAVACIILQSSVTGLATDTEWKSYDEAISSTGLSAPDVALFDSKVKKEIVAWANTFIAHGGSISQAVFKRIYVASPGTDVLSDIVKNAVQGTSTQEALETNIIQIQLLWERGGTLYTAVTEDVIKAIAANLNGNTEIVNRKILFVTMPSAPADISTVGNLAWHQSSIASNADQVYESALTIGYLSSFDFGSTTPINDVEYTEWRGASLVTTENLTTGVGGYSIITSIRLSGSQEYRVLVGGLVGSGERVLTEYFVVVITQLCTDALAGLVLSKIKYSEALFGSVYSTLANVLDQFTGNQLFESNFVSPITRVVNRDGVNYWVIKENESLPYGYKLITLPVTQADRAAKTYTGTILYIALGSQIRTVELRGLVIGGI